MAGTSGRLLLGVVLTTATFSLWMSNTATAALMLTRLVLGTALIIAGFALVRLVRTLIRDPRENN